MYLYYTIIGTGEDLTHSQPQQVPEKSLGGYCSVTKVLSGENQAIFPDIAELTISQNKALYRCLVLKNTFLFRTENIRMYIELADPENTYGKFRVGISEPSEDGEIMNVANANTRPFYVEFQDITVNVKDDEGNWIIDESKKMSLPDMDPGKMYAVWMERTIDQDNAIIRNRLNPNYLYKQCFPNQPDGQYNWIEEQWRYQSGDHCDFHFPLLPLEENVSLKIEFEAPTTTTSTTTSTTTTSAPPTISIMAVPAAPQVGEQVILASTETPSGGTYQWYRDDLAVSGKTAPSFFETYSTVQTHTYYCRYTVSGTTVQSNAVTVTWGPQ